MSRSKLYTSEVLSKEFIKGVLYVTVQFSNRNETFTENFLFSNTEDVESLTAMIDSKLSQLNGMLPAMDSIELGEVSPD